MDIVVNIMIEHYIFQKEINTPSSRKRAGAAGNHKGLARKDAHSGYVYLINLF